MALHIRFPVQNRWKALAAQLLIGSLTCQVGLIDTALTTSRAYAADDQLAQDVAVLSLDQLTDLQIPASAKNPAQTINRATDSAVVVTAHVPMGTATFTAQLTDQFGKQVEDTSKVTSTGIATATIHASSLADGAITLRAAIETESGITMPWVTGASVTKDTVKPEKPTITAPLDPFTTSTSILIVQGTADDHSTVAAIKDHAVITQAPSTGTFTLSVPLTEGKNRFKIIAMDTAGNESFAVSLPTITNIATPADPTPTPATPEPTTGEQVKAPIKGGKQLVDFGPGQPISVETGSQTTHHGKLSATSLGHLNPTHVALPDVTPLGAFYDLTSSNQTVFPLTVRLYYTQADLVAAHVSNERQLKGLYYYDVSRAAWKSFEQTTIHTEDTTNDGIAYAGYVEAVTTHLTMMVIGADTIAPAKVTNLTAEAGDMRTRVTWNAIGDAQGYWLRYRKATSIDTVPYTTVFVSGQQQTSYTVSGLANGTLYEFGVATEDAAGNQSGFAVVEQTPTAAGPTTDFITPATARLTSAASKTTTTTAIAQSSTPSSGSSQQSQDQQTPTQQKEDEAPTDGTVKGGTDQKDQTQSARSLVTLLIVLIAAAAGFGGYYGYQWWTARPEEFDEPTEEHEETRPPKKADKVEKNDKAGGRW